MSEIYCIPKTYKNYKVEIICSLNLDMNNSPAGWSLDKSLLISEWFAKMSPPLELVQRILDHEIREMTIAIKSGKSLEAFLDYSEGGKEAHNKIMEDKEEKASRQMYLDFIKTKSPKLYNFTIQVLDSKEVV